MSRRLTSVVFIMIAAVLIAVKYLSAAIFGSRVTNWDEQLFDNMLIYVGNTLSNFSLLSLLMGIVYIIWGEYSEWNPKKRK